MKSVDELSEQELLKVYEDIASIFEFCNLLFERTLQNEVRTYLVRNDINPSNEAVKTLFPEVVNNG